MWFWRIKKMLQMIYKNSLLYIKNDDGATKKFHKNFFTSQKRKMCTICGRSMVEMFGVLAIIGVLSVGAISGYSKAMMKYKLNKQAEAVNILINNAIQLRPELARAFDGVNMITAELFHKLNLIPDGLRFSGGGMYDDFHTYIRITYGISSWTVDGVIHKNLEYYISAIMDRAENKITGQSSQICHNLLNVTKENSMNIFEVQMRQGNAEASGDSARYTIYGDQRCTPSKKCLKNMTLDDVQEICQSCASTTYCAMYIFIAT